MRKIVLFVSLGLLLGIVSGTEAEEPPAPSVSTNQTTTATPPADIAVSAPTDFEKVITAYLEANMTNGALVLPDPVAAKDRKVRLLRLQGQQGKNGNNLYTCADFQDMESGELLDLDVDISNQSGTLNVLGIKIHKVNGTERFTYDQEGNRIPSPAK